MILTRLDNLTAYRMHLPKWAVAPTSGAGAARHGGRANRPDVGALYLSLDVETAVKEYQQVSTLLPPGTLLSYRVTVERVADFRAGFAAAHWDPLWEDFPCDWRELWFNQHVEPPVGSSAMKSSRRVPRASCSSHASPAAEPTWCYIPKPS